MHLALPQRQPHPLTLTRRVLRVDRPTMPGVGALRLIYGRVLQQEPCRQASDVSSSATFTSPSDSPLQ